MPLAVPGQRRVYRSSQRDISRDMKMGHSKTGCGQKAVGRRPPFGSLTCSEGVFCVSGSKIDAENQNQYKGVRRRDFFQKPCFHCASRENVAHHVRRTKLAANSVPLEDRHKIIAAVIQPRKRSERGCRRGLSGAPAPRSPLPCCVTKEIATAIFAGHAAFLEKAKREKPTE